MASKKKQSGKTKASRDDANCYASAAETGLRLDEEFDSLLSELRDVQELEKKRKEKKGGCTGQPCRGEGMGSHFVRADSCPKPCDPNQYTDGAIMRAKERALRQANLNCIDKVFSADCKCAEGTYKEIKRVCVEVKIQRPGDPLPVKYCAYDVYYEYTGKCRPR